MQFASKIAIISDGLIIPVISETQFSLSLKYNARISPTLAKLRQESKGKKKKKNFNFFFSNGSNLVVMSFDKPRASNFLCRFSRHRFIFDRKKGGKNIKKESKKDKIN